MYQHHSFNQSSSCTKLVIVIKYCLGFQCTLQDVEGLELSREDEDRKLTQLVYIGLSKVEEYSL